MNHQLSPKNHRELSLNRLRSFSQFLDNAIPIPGTSYRIGIDPILGLFPAAGDYLSAALSTYIVIQSAQLGASNSLLWQMVINIIIDALVGTIPLLGDLFDMTWKANVKNIALLESYLNSHPSHQPANKWFILLLLAGLILVVTGLSLLTLFIVQVILQAIGLTFLGK